MTSEKLKYSVRINYAPTTNNYTLSQKGGYRKQKWNAKHILSIIGYVVSIAIITWFVFSWVNIICNNTSTFEYAWWNAFQIFANLR